MKIKRIFRTLAILLVLSSNMGCDQITKTIVREKIAHHEQIGLLNNYLTLTRIENTGAFMSLGDSLPQPVKMLLLTFLPILLLAFCLVYVLTKIDLSNLNTLGICFIIGGGAGNIYDRVLHGSVTDFIHIDFILFRTGIFNMADLSVMVGTLLVLADVYFTQRKIKSQTIEK